MLDFNVKYGYIVGVDSFGLIARNESEVSLDFVSASSSKGSNFKGLL